MQKPLRFTIDELVQLRPPRARARRNLGDVPQTRRALAEVAHEPPHPEAGSGRTARSSQLVRPRAKGHRFSAHSSGNEFSMRFVFALYVCIVALGLICGIAVSVA